MRTMIAILLLVAMPAQAQQAGDGFVCTGPDGDVTVTVGRVELLSEMTGGPQSPDVVIAHVYMETADDFVEHAAFDADAFAGCSSDPETPFDDVAFEEALGTYLAAARTGTPRYFTIPPGEAFRLAVQGG